MNVQPIAASSSGKGWLFDPTQAPEQPIANGTWVICEVEGHRFTAQVKAHVYKDEASIYQVEAELPQGKPLFAVRANQIVDVF